MEGATLHVEPTGNLWFGSAPALEDELLKLIAEHKDVALIVVHCGGLGRIDLTGAWTLSEMLDEIRRAGILIEVAGVPGHAQRMLRVVGQDS